MQEPSSSIRVLIADDHRLVWQGLRALLKVAKDIKVIGEACDGVQAVEMATERRPTMGRFTNMLTWIHTESMRYLEPSSSHGGH